MHRPRYDDWSLPKGKLAPASRRCWARCVRSARRPATTRPPAARSGCSAYPVLQDGRVLPKSVRWWAMRAGAGTFVPGDEVDALQWLPPDEATARLTAGRDLGPLELLLAAGIGTTTVLLVRHGHAGDRGAWEGDDDERPLSARGRAQAELLVPLLRAYRPVRVLSAPPRRCLATVEPVAAALGLQVQVEPSVGEEGFAADPSQALHCVGRLAAADGPTVVCSQGGAIPALVDQLTRAAGREPGPVRARKGSVWALTFLGGRLVDADLLPPPA